MYTDEESFLSDYWWFIILCDIHTMQFRPGTGNQILHIAVLAKVSLHSSKFTKEHSPLFIPKPTSDLTYSSSKYRVQGKITGFFQMIKVIICCSKKIKWKNSIFFFTVYSQISCAAVKFWCPPCLFPSLYMSCEYVKQICFG